MRCGSAINHEVIAIVVEYDGVDDGGGRVGKSSSKVRKPSKAWNICKGHQFGGTKTKKTPFDISSTSSSSLTPLHQVFICGTHVLPLLLQFWRYALEEDFQAQESGRRCLMAGRMSREFFITKTPRWGHFGIETTRELVAKKYYEDLQLVPIPTHSWKDISHNSGGIAHVYRLEKHESRLGRDCLCLPIEKTRAIIRKQRNSTAWTLPPGIPRAGADNNWCTRAGGRSHVFDLDCGYHPRVFYEDIKWESHDRMQNKPSARASHGKSLSARPREVSCIDLVIS